MAFLKQMCGHLLLVLVIVTSQANAVTSPRPVFAIIGSQQLVANEPYTIVAQSESDQPMKMKVALELNGEIIDDENLRREFELEAYGEKILTLNVPNLSQGSYQFVTNTIVGEFSYNEKKRVNFVQAANEKNEILMLQTDKSMYKPGEKIRFRALVLDRETRPANVEKATFFVKDPKGNRIKQWQDARLNEFSQFNDEFELSQNAILGNHEIHMRTKESERVIKFELAEYVLPQFSLDVITPKYVMHDEPEFPIVIEVKYTHGKPVKGMATIKVSLEQDPNDYYYYDSEEETSFWPEFDSITKWSIEKPINGKLEIKFNPYEHMRIKPGKLDDETLKVEVTVIEDLTSKSFTGSTQLKLVEQGLEADLISQTQGLRPGTEYFGRIKLTTKDGQPIHDTKNPVKFGYRFKLHDLKTGKESVTKFTDETAFVHHGLIPLNFKIPKDARELNVRVMYKNQRLSLPRVFSSSHQMENYVQFIPLNRQGNADKVVEIIKENTPNAQPNIRFKIESSEPIARINYIISAEGKILYAQRIHSEHQTLNEVVVPFKPLMKNGFTIIVYFLRKEVAEWTTESIHYVPAVETMDTLELSASTTQARPNEDVTIIAKTKPASFVAVVGIDQSMILLRKPKYISLEDVKEQNKKNERSLPYRYEYGTHTFGVNSLIFTSLISISNIYYYPNQPIRDSSNIQYAVPRGVTRGGQALFSQSRGISNLDSAEVTFEESVPKTQLRKDFPETWLWASQVSDNTGVAKFETKMPDTITSWVVNAFALNKETGLTFPRNPVEVTVFNPFFIKMNLPYSIVRGEVAAVQVLIYNYLGKNKQVDVTLFNELGEFLFSKPSQNSNDDEEIAQERQTKTVSVDSDGVSSIIFLIRPEQVGHIRLQLTAQTSDSSAADKIEQLLLVKPEGQTQYFNKAVMITLNQTHPSFLESVKIEIPTDIVQGSRLITVKAIGDILGTSISNLGNLLRVPYGCGEQNMAGMVPNIVALEYLTSISKLNPELETKARNNLESGYQRQLNYQRHDGGFSAFGKSDSESCTWLTAFVLTSFIQANKFIHIDSSVLSKAVNFLFKVRNDGGNFIERGYVFDKHMMGGLGRTFAKGNSPALDAYILVALHEAYGKGLVNLDLLKPTITSLEKVLDTFPQPNESDKDRDYDFYPLSIIAYALHVVGSSKSEHAFNRLWALRQTNEAGQIFFDKPERNEQVQIPRNRWNYYSYLYLPNSNAVEATAYTLQLLNKRQEMTNAIRLLQWLISKQNSNGGFASTQDTVVALNALSAFASRVYKPDSNVQIKFESTDGKIESKPALQGQFELNGDNSLILHQAELGERGFEEEILAITQVNVSATGNGIAVVQVGWQYNVAVKDENNFFDLQVKVTQSENKEQNDLEVCASYLKGKETNMAIVELETPSGFEFISDSIQKVRSTVQRVDVIKSNTQASFYFNKLTKSPTCFTVSIERITPVANLKPALVSVYDYYQVNQASRAFYNVDQVNSCDIVQCA